MIVISPLRFIATVWLWGAIGLGVAGDVLAENLAEQPEHEKRPLLLNQNGRWIGNAICYGPHRKRQRPGGLQPSKDQLREDLCIIAKHWPLLRTYGSTDFANEMLEVILEEKLPIHVMLGAWVESEMKKVDDVDQLDASTTQENVLQVQKVIELANKYEELVIAISIGNETQVEWSSHKVPANQLIKYLRLARAGTSVPVTTADDFMFWSEASSQTIADEIDFITTHVHPVWHGQESEDALAFVREKYELVVDRHPGSMVVIGETGWATQKHNTGPESKFISGKMGENEQLVACQQIVEWAEKEKIATFIFEAFDEPWKGAAHSSGVEKHWGQFREDRTPKKIFSISRNKQD